MGDALAVVLLEKKNFKPSDFRRIHPGGSLGQRLEGKVKDLMLSGTAVPTVPENISMQDAVKEINRGGLGATLVADPQKTLLGIITDGDIRRMVATGKPISNLKVEDVMTKQPRFIDPEAPAYEALYIMERHQITVLAAVNSNGEIQGMLHLHDILGKGQFTFNGT